MRTVHHYLEAEKARREETGEAGFSLIELIIVVVILGILAAIAIPIFLNIQGQAKDNALQTVAANGATQVAAYLAQNPDDTPADVDLSNLVTGDVKSVAATGTNIDHFCVAASRNLDGSDAATSGPDCTP